MTDTILQLLSIFAAAAAVYAAIRVDLTRAMMRAEEAHRRLDEHIAQLHDRRAHGWREAEQ